MTPEHPVHRAPGAEHPGPHLGDALSALLDGELSAEEEAGARPTWSAARRAAGAGDGARGPLVGPGPAAGRPAVRLLRAHARVPYRPPRTAPGGDGLRGRRRRPCAARAGERGARPPSRR